MTTKVFEFEMGRNTKAKVGTEVKLWLKPDSDTVIAYAKGSVGGQGYVGEYEDNKAIFYNYLNAKKDYKAVIIDFEYNIVYIKFDFAEDPFDTSGNFGCMFILILFLLFLI